MLSPMASFLNFLTFYIYGFIIELKKGVMFYEKAYKYIADCFTPGGMCKIKCCMMPPQHITEK